jgi:AAA+ ATPase superfamily predicted ATPase
MVIKNPFPVVGYHGPSMFCNREKETDKLSGNLQGGLNTTLISLRRMGKTALIYHVFNQILKEKQSICLYVDLYPTRSIKDLTRQLATASINVLPGKKWTGKRFLAFLKSLRPVITYDPLTGAPGVRFEYSAQSDYEITIAALLNFLNDQGTDVYLAFDEFQVIASYEEGNAEAMLRTMIQPLNNVHFLFSGSNRHMMTEIFNSSKRPFFASTRIISLPPISAESYSRFIAEKFLENKRKISPDAIGFILEWTRRHTYYTQSVCNTLFNSGIKELDIHSVKETCGEILDEQEKTFLQYRNLLTGNQWQLLTAVAKEGNVYKPHSGEFVSKHSLGTPASITRALDALLTKEMIYEEIDSSGKYYSVYDLFLSRWLERQ